MCRQGGIRAVAVVEVCGVEVAEMTAGSPYPLELGKLRGHARPLGWGNA